MIASQAAAKTLNLQDARPRSFASGQQAARLIAALACSGSVAACSGVQSALDPAGPNARAVVGLFWIFTALGLAVLLPIAVLLVLVTRRRVPDRHPLVTDPVRERRTGRIIGACVALTAGTVTVLTLVSFVEQSRIFTGNDAPDMLRVTGHQWWWQVEYLSDRPDERFLTANEIHIPTGSPAGVVLDTRDVIHSFWIPSLAGKTDQISGHLNRQQLYASREGIYRGQCAEFCGLQHAHMAMKVVATSRQEFDRWRQAQLAPAAAPTDEQRRLGLEVFLRRGCMLCHTIRGTLAGGRLGPDLTHLAGRTTIAAGVLPNVRGHLAAWILDPQSFKPGTQMPKAWIEAAELEPLLDYLAGLR